MKTVQDKEGNRIEVKDDTPCHAGKNGALPIMLDENLDADVFAEMAERNAIWLAKAPEREQEAIVASRNKERGSWQEQIAYLIDNGFDALKQRDDDIKLRHPKPNRET